MSGSYGSYFRAVLLIGDITAFCLAFVIAVWLRWATNPGKIFVVESIPVEGILYVLPYILVVWVSVFFFFGLYRLDRSAVDEAIRVLQTVGVALALMMAVAFFNRSFLISRGLVIYFVPAVIVTTVFVRAFIRFGWHKVLRLRPVQGQALVVGTGRLAR
ncbi:MAG: hypothetical protein HN348_26350, partial [Proteobacteria bacterium]|nr:hypothetical protein [Pseudomonadota bacterium]